MKIKICGITNLDDALLCAEEGADMIGLIFVKKSRRQIPLKKAMQIIEQLPSSVEKVGVFANHPLDKLRLLLGKLKLDRIQLHGDETPEYVSKIKLPVIKAFRVSSEFNYSEIDSYQNIIPLLDSFSETQLGGTGKVFDWQKIPEDIRSKSIVAGGISERNVDKLFTEIKPYAIDLSSSVEKFPGKKDELKVKSFFNKIKNLRSEQW